MRTLMSTRTRAALACCSRPGADSRNASRTMRFTSARSMARRAIRLLTVIPRRVPHGISSDHAAVTDSHSPATRIEVARLAASTAAKSRGRRNRRARVKERLGSTATGSPDSACTTDAVPQVFRPPGACGPWRGAPRSRRGRRGTSCARESRECEHA